MPDDASSIRETKRTAAHSWKVIAASVTGLSHVARGQGNEDSELTACLPQGALMLALADGAGSAKRAAEGSRLAVATAVDALAAALAGEDDLPLTARVLRAVLARVRRTLAARAREVRVRPGEFACTLLLAVIQDDTLAVLQLGDGAVVARAEEDWQRVTRPLHGRHAGETVFVTSRGATRLASVEIRPLAGIHALALLTDGLEPVATNVASGAPHAPFFDPLVTFARGKHSAEELGPELERFLGSDRVQSRTADDLSLILAVRR